jgi:hypothetical protein
MIMSILDIYIYIYMSSNLLYIVESFAICKNFIFVAIVLHTPNASSTVLLTMAFNHLPSSDS